MSDLLRYTWLLLATGLRIWWNKLRRSNWRFRISWGVLLTFITLFAIIFSVAINLSVRFATRFGNSEGITALPGGLLFGVFFFTFVTAFGLTLSALYLSSDLELLMVAPIPIHAIFIAKLVQASLPAYLLVALPMLPSLWSVGQALNYSWLFYVASIPVLIILPLLPVGLAALAVMVVVRVVPPKRLAEALGLVAVVISVAFSLWGQGASAGAMRGAQPSAIFNSVRALDIPFTPPSLAGHGLIALGQGDWEGALRNLGGFVAFSVAGFLVALDASASLYYSGWAKVKSGLGSGPRRPARRRGVSWFGSLFAHPIPALLIKDLRVIPRDLSNLVQLLSPLIFSLFWAWQLLRFPMRNLDTGSLGVLWPMASAIWSVGITGMIFSRFALTGVSREGRAVWVLRAAPISAWHILISKFLVTYIPFVVLGSLMVIGLGRIQQSDWWSTLQGIVAIWIVGAGGTGIGLGVGGAAPRFDWPQPHQMVGYGQGCLVTIVSGMYSGAILLIFAGGRLLAAALPDIVLLVWVGALALAGLLTLAAVLIPLWLAAERLANLDI